MFFMSLIFFALNCCPLTALHASGPKCCEKIILKKYQSLWKSPIGSHLSFPLCVDMNQTQGRHCPSPPPLQTHQASFLQVIWCPCCIESNPALRRRKPVWQNTFKPPKNAAHKCRPLKSPKSPWASSTFYRNENT